MSRMTIELGPDQAEWLERKAAETGETKTRVIRSALALAQIASRENREGNSLGIIRGDRILREIVGFTAAMPA